MGLFNTIVINDQEYQTKNLISGDNDEYGQLATFKADKHNRLILIESGRYATENIGKSIICDGTLHTIRQENDDFIEEKIVIKNSKIVEISISNEEEACESFDVVFSFKIS